MTIRIIDTRIGIRDQTDWGRGYQVVGEGGTILATADTVEEAEQAKRAFEQVLLPRFTRDEAIAAVKPALDARWYPETDEQAAVNRGIQRGVRLALEALAARGVFVDGDVTIRDQSGNGNDLSAPTMADLLDAAGIR